MVSYYNPVAMYRQQTAMNSASGSVTPPPQFHSAASNGVPPPPPPPAGSWYSGYHHQAHHQQFHCQDTMMVQPNGTTNSTGAASTGWHHPIFHQDYTDFSVGPLGSSGGGGGGSGGADTILGHETGLPSPPITVSAGSDLSSPSTAAGSGHGTGGTASVSPPVQAKTIIPPVVQVSGRRSPYEWMRKPSYQSQPNPGKTRTKDKYRVVYTDHQRLELEKEFHYSRYITIRRKAELASNLGLSERQVKIWFQNRRAKERKQVKKREELTTAPQQSATSVASSSASQTLVVQREFKLEQSLGGGTTSPVTPHHHHHHHQYMLHHQSPPPTLQHHPGLVVGSPQLHHQQHHLHQLCSPD